VTNQRIHNSALIPQHSVLAVALGALLFALSFPAEAQQPTKVPRIGVLRTGSHSDPLIDAFRQGLRELGYIEGKNVFVEYRWAEGKNERLAELAAELVRLKVDVIIAAGPGPILAAKQATRTIPIVMPVVINPVGSGLVESLARPGGNLTGFASQTDELAGKWMELLKEILPKVSRVAVMVDAPNDIGQTKAAKDAARPWNINLQVLIVSGPADFEIAFDAARKNRADALIQLPSAFLYAHRMRLTKLAISYRLPTIHNQSDWVIGAGGLMSYAPNLADMFRESAVYVVKILNGAKPSELPIQQPTKFEFIVNLKTAKQIGLIIPPSVLARADRVIK
jgi:putative tryptophan/tyrosine transport system substrate-binding protein